MDWTQQLDIQLEHAEVLTGALADERQALLDADADALMRVNGTKAQAAQSLANFSQALTQAVGESAVGAWLRARCGEDAEARWNKLAGVLEDCRRANDVNGVILNSRHADVQAQLARLTASDATYDAGGDRSPTAHSPGFNAKA